MPNESIHFGDIGTKIIVTVKDENDNIVDIGSANSLKIILKKPGGTKITEESPTLETDGSDGKMSYTTQDGDIDESGRWRVQAWADLPSGEWYTTVQDFTVQANL